jgi:Tir chaperone protein (CesT) family
MEANYPHAPATHHCSFVTILPDTAFPAWRRERPAALTLFVLTGRPMSKEAYYQLVDAICAEYRIANPAAMYENCDLVVDDVAFSLRLDDADPDKLYVYCEFDEMPQQTRMRTLERVLEKNLMAYGDENAPMYSYNAESRRLLAMGGLRLSVTTLETALAALTRFVALANAWRESHFLDEAPQAAGRSNSTSTAQRLGAIGAGIANQLPHNR